MTIETWLKQAEHKLNSAGIATARLDSLVLLADQLDRSKAWLLAHPESKISSADLARLKNVLDQRTTHIPLAFVRGKTEFYGRNFVITRDVLEPRPESETMIDLLKTIDLPDYFNHQTVRILDVGTGSGALAITAKLELPDTQVHALDISDRALSVAKTNVDLFTLNISVIKSDLLQSLTDHYDVLLCNLPYVPDDFSINRAAMHEPKLAIFGGKDGLNLYRKLFDQVSQLTQKPLFILCESLPPQHTKLAHVAADAGYIVRQEDDFIQLFEHA